MIWKTTISFIAALFLSVGIYAQTCPQNNVNVLSVEFRKSDGTPFTPSDDYPIGTEVDGQIFAIFGGSTSNAYSLGVKYNIYVNDIVDTRVEECLFEKEEVVKNTPVFISNFTWSWGDKLEIKDIFMRWQTGNSLNKTCPDLGPGGSNSQCYGNDPGFLVRTPLVANFSYNQDCNSEIVSFTDLTTGGYPPASGYEYTWIFKDETGTTLLGEIEDEQNPSFDFEASGTYEVTLEAYDGSLTKTETKTVTVFEPGDASISYGDSPYCSIDGTASVTQTGVSGGTYEGSSTNLSINTNTGEINISESTTGTYTVTYAFSDNGCDYTTNTSIIIVENPVAQITGNKELTCTNTEITLDASGSTLPGTASYSWTMDNADGNEVGTSATLSVDTPGTYFVTVTDSDNGCSDSTSVNVTQDITAPSAEAGETMELTCTTTSVTLNGSGNSSNEEADLSYAWTGPGEFTSDTAMPAVTVEGIYTLTVTDNDNGCFANDTVEVTKDDNVPTASIEGNEELNCTTTEITLDASGSKVNGTASYSWTMNTADGDEVGTEATLLVETAGTYFLTVTDTDNGCTATNSVTVTQDITAPTAEAGDDMELTCTTTSVTLNGSGNSSNEEADLSYAWTGPEGFTSDMAMPSVSVIGTYTLTVTDNDNGCFVTDTVEVTQDITAPSAEAGETMELTCTTTSVTLNGSGNSSNEEADLSYAWTGPGEFTSDQAMPKVTVEGTYTLTVTDNDNGCSATDTVEVTKDANVPTASIKGNEELNCTTTAITLDASGSTVNGTASYSWTMDTADGNEVGTGVTLEVTTAGVYFLTVTDLDNGCTATNSETVTQDNTAPSAEAGDDMELTCTTTSITLNGSGDSANTDADLSYAWTGPEGFTSDEAMPSVSVVGTYTLTVTDNDNGCFTTDSVEVTQDITAPSAEAGETMELTCTTTSVTLNGSGSSTNDDADLSYAWTGPGEFTSEEAMPAVTVEGIYTLTVTDNDNGCFANDTVEVTKDDNVPTASIEGNEELNCTTTAITLDASGSTVNGTASYSWTMNTADGDEVGTEATLLVETAGMYFLTVTDTDNGCTATNSVTVTQDITAPTAEAGDDMELTCTATSVTLNGSGSSTNDDADLSYAWTGPGEFTSEMAIPSVSVTGTYTLTVTDTDNGCFATDTVEVTQDITAPTAEAGDTMELTCTTTSVTLNGSGNSSNEEADLSYAWTGPGEFTSDQAMPSVTVEGIYTLTVSDNDNGCFATDTVEITKDDNVPTASITGNQELNCTTTEITLDASGSTVNGTASYSWTMNTVDGNEVGTEITLLVETTGTYFLTVTDTDNGCTATNSVTVTQDITAPTAEAGDDMELTCTTTSVTLNGSGSSTNDDASLSYAWTGPGEFTSDQAMPSVSVIGTYTLTVTDNDNACFATDSVEVTQDITAPTAEAGDDMELTCTTTSVTLSGSGSSTNDDADLSYAWTGPGEFTSDQAMPNVTVEGTYTLTVTDNDNGCFTTDSVEVTKDANVPTASIEGNEELNCTTTAITLDASGSTVNGTASYSWTMDTADDDEVGTEATLLVETAGTYFLTVTDTDNGCTATNSVTVTQDITAPSAEAGDDIELTCTATSVTLNGSGSSTNDDADLSYAWTGPGEFTSEIAMPSVSVIGTYTLTVTDNDNGCFVTDTVEVTQDITAPTAEAGDDMELTCITTSVTLNGSGSSTNDDADLSYTWTGPGEFTSDQAMPNVTVEGTYTLTVTDNDNGCFATDTVEVTKDDNIPTASIEGNEELNCTTTAITLNASGSVVNGTASYSWTMNTVDGNEVGTEITLLVETASTYFLTVTDTDNGCTATNSVTVTQDITAPTAEAGDDMELTCTTTSVTLNGSGNSANDDASLSYAWTGPGEFTSEMAMPSVSVIGTYTLTVTDTDNGCFTTDTVEVTQDITAPTAEAGETMELTCTTTSVTLNGSGSTTNDDADLSYAWTGPAEFTSDMAMPSVTVEGTYTLTVTDNDNGCFATDTVEVTKDANVPTASIEDNEELNCNNTAITLDASGSVVNGTASYSWTMDTADGTEVGTKAILEVTTAGVYFLTVTDLDNGCTATNSVEVTQDNTAPTAEAGDDMELTCTTTSVTLNGSGSSTNDDADLSYAWTGPGEFTSEMAIPSVSVTGTYTLTVTDTDNGCFATDTVEVTQDITAPTPEAGETMELTCTTTSVTLNGSGSSTNDDADLSYAWTGPGEFTSDMAMPSVSVTGTYTLTVTDNDNGCFATDTVEVTQDITAPTAEAGETMELTCTTTSVTLNGSGSSTNDDADLSYAWTGPGEFTSEEAMPAVTVEGIYTLTVTDNDNGCFANDTVELTKDDNVPTASIEGNEELNCNNTAITLDASGSVVNGTASYSWTMNTADGDEVGTEATLLVETAGTYFLTVTDTDNGCTATNSVTVTQDITAPTAEAGDDMELTCTATSVTLNGSGSSTNDDADLSYAWTGPGEFTSEMAMPSVSVIGTYTLTVTDDDNGCFATDSVEVTQDITAPTAEAGDDMELTCTTTSVTLNGSGNSANENSSLSYAWTGPGEFTSDQAMPSVTVEGTYTLTVTDNDNGCFATDSVEITKDDNVPTASITGNQELNCTTTEITLDASGSTVNGTASYSWTMNTADGTEVGTEATLEVTTAGVYFLTVTDLDNGCTATNSVEVIFTPDTESAVITECASEVNVSADAGGCDASEVDLGIPTASDNCDTELTYENDAPEVFPLGQTIVTWTITDASNNSVQCEQIVNVTDDEAPVIDTIADINVESDIDVCGAVVEFENIIATDNCEIETIEVTEGLVSGSVYPVGTTTVTITVTDMSGNTTSTSFDVNVTDTEAPEISCPENITVSTETGVSYATVDFEDATATDNCEVSVEQTGGPVSGSQFEIGTTTITFTATDSAGNTSECSFTITVEDNEDPTITCPADIDLTNDAGVCGAVVEFTIPAFDDSSGFATIEQTDGLEPGAIFPVGTTTVTYIVTDEAGNSASCSFDVTVIDSEAPVVEEMDDITVNNDNGICGAVVNFNTVEATDNCEVDSVQITEGLESGSEFPVGTTTVTYTVTDINGNVTTESFTVTVVDNEAPEISCPTNITVDTETGVSFATVDFENATATDNCEVSVEQTGGPVSGSQFEIGTTTITFTATDTAGNTSECSFTVTVEDNEDPTITCPADIDLTNDAGVCGAAVEFTIPEFSDNSGFATIEQTAGLESGDVFPVGTTTVSYTVTDEAGNSANCSFDVTVIDSEAPVVEEMDDITVNNDNGICGAVVNFNTVEATDNCEVDSVVITEGLESGSEFPVGTTTVTYTVTDINGNVSTESFTVTVVDNEAPEINCPTNITVDTETGVSYATVDFEDATATDNCEVSVEQTGGPVSGSQFEIGTTTITFTATDATGNTSECSFTITVEDNEDPTITCPADIDLTNDAGVCGAVVDFTIPEFSDNSGFATIEQTAGLESGDVFPVGTTTVSYTVTDEAGNSANCSFDVTVIDSEAPVVEEMDDITVNNDNGICGAVVNFNTVEATDNCEVDSVVITEGLESGSEFPVGTTTVTYTVTDINGNVSTESFTVTVVDNEAPEISCPTNITVSTETGVSYATVDFENATATDNCEVSVEQTGGPVSGSQFEIGTTTITFTATDAAGNTSECSFTVTVEDNEDPTISCPSDISENVDAGICGAAVNFETPAGMDNSGNVTVEQTAGLISGEVFPVGTTTITFTATDAAGNSVTCSFDITVTDDEAPVIEEMENIVMNTDNGICGAVVDFIAPSATDNCEVDNVTLTEGVEPGTVYPVGVTNVTYTATDNNGNTASTSFTVTVIDNEAPSIECPENVTETVENGVTSVVVNYEAVTTIDNCEGTTVELTSGIASGEEFPIGETEVTYTVTDASGNSTTCSFTVTVEEEPAPAPEAPEVDVTQATCAVPTGTITVTVINGLTYSIDGENYQADGIFDNLTPGTYDIVAQDESEQISEFTTVEINDPVAEEIDLVNNGEIDLCTEDSTFDLFELFAGDYDDTGVWVDTNNTGALDNGFIDPSMLAVGSYTFEYQIDGNCPSTTQVSVLINDDCIVLNCSVEDLKDSISNAVTPNGDDINDFFEVDLDTECGFTYDLKIFNRWGAKVFDAQNYQNNWDGYSDSSFTSSNQLPSGTYFYVLEIRNSDFEPIQGYIYLGTK